MLQAVVHPFFEVKKFLITLNVLSFIFIWHAKIDRVVVLLGRNTDDGRNNASVRAHLGDEDQEDRQEEENGVDGTVTALPECMESF